MTVINALKFNETTAGMVADSQSSTNLRKYELADKILTIEHNKGARFLLGGAGMADILYETSERLRSEVCQQEECTMVGVVQKLSEILVDIKRNVVDGFLRSTYGISSTDAIQGHAITAEGKVIKIDEQLKTKIVETYTLEDKRMQQYFYGEFLLIGKAQKGIRLYRVELHGPTLLCARPYASIGSGSDESDKILYNFVRDLKREQRKDINFVEGMAALLKATNASIDLNQGVGGVPTICYLKDDKIVTLKEDESRLAAELVRVKESNLIPEKLFRDSLEALLVQVTGFEELEKAVFKDNPQYDKIMRVLRGYKA